MPLAVHSVEFARVRLLVLLIALCSPSHAGIVAHFQTSRGTVDVELQYDNAPQAVANFITLAEGSRPWVDPLTGRIRNDPFYNGIRIHRTSDTSGFKFAQGGSPKGDGSDGPGYTFKDEFNSPLIHVPYVLSMANAGPNTNGSQFFFTGSVPQPTFDHVHTIFGLVISPASRAVVDAMIVAGPNATTINEVTITRTDAPAIAFNEHAQNLPVVAQAKGNLVVTPNVSASWNPNENQATGDIFRAFRSITLAPNSWLELPSAKRQSGIAPAGFVSIIGPAALDDASASKAFYNLTWVTHPGSVTPTRLTNRTVEMKFGAQTLIYSFDGSGGSGVGTFKANAESSEMFPFILTSFTSTGHAFNFSCYNLSGPVAGGYQFMIGCDTATSTLITGRHSSGVATITR